MPDKQHYIPICYLRGFSFDYPANLTSDRDDLKIFIHDSIEKNIKLKSPKNICQINRFYNVKDEEGNEDRSIDDFFKETENNFAKVSSEFSSVRLI